PWKSARVGSVCRMLPADAILRTGGPVNARSVIDGNLSRVEERIAGACARAGRRRGDVTLVAVTKSVSPEVSAILPQLGVTDIGENRPQVLWAKAALVSPAVRWHLIGHLQRNKV